MRGRALRRIRTLAAWVLVTVLIGGLLVGHLLSKPALKDVGAAPPQLQARDVAFEASTGNKIHGWLAPGRQGGGVVLLLHGVRSNRLQMLERALFLHEAGYGVLLIDLPAHGMSGGHRITFGAHESKAVAAALDELKAQFPGEKVGVIGVSLGAASAVLASPTNQADAYVLESMYSTIEAAVVNRLNIRFGEWGRLMAPVLLWQLPIYAGVTPGALKPVDQLPLLSAPVLMASGDADLHTHWHETEHMFSLAQPPKQLWRVSQAAHVDLHAFDPVEYEQRILAFLGIHLRGRQ